jgi:ribose 5-phosphate isomerase B
MLDTEIATLARQHNDANVCALPARFVSFDEAKQMLKHFSTLVSKVVVTPIGVEKIRCK